MDFGEGRTEMKLESGWVSGGTNWDESRVVAAAFINSQTPLTESSSLPEMHVLRKGYVWG